MREINIAKILHTKRREKGITQDDLAEYMGVSKASVSKWETGQSYPDITFLPQLAAYFNISIDELMDYAPQMTKEDIKKLYHHMSSSFAMEPFDQVMMECHRIIKKYFSCFPLLFQMAILLVNHHMLAKEKTEKEAILNAAAELCIRIKTESDDVWLAKYATSFEAVCYIMLQEPQEVLDLIGESIRPMVTDYEVMGQAYQMMGNIGKATEVTQIGMYQHLLALIGATPAFLMLNAEDNQKIDDILHRALSVSAIYNLEELHPNTMVQIYYTAAQLYGIKGMKGKTLDMLQKYADLCTKRFFPITLHGDSFFDAMDEWFEDFDLGVNAPRDERVIKDDMYQMVLSNPGFIFLAEQPQYKSILETLKSNLGGKSYAAN